MCGREAVFVHQAAIFLHISWDCFPHRKEAYSDGQTATYERTLSTMQTAMPLRSICLFLFASLTLPAPLAAQVKFSSPVVKLGEVRGGPPLTLRVPFQNPATMPMEVIDVVIGCSCLSAKLDRRLLEPGETGAMEISLRTLGHKNGPYLWTLKVRNRSSDPKGEITETPLRIEATVRNEVTLEPSELAIFATGDIQKEVILTDLRASPFRILRVESTVAGVELTTQEQHPGTFRIHLNVRGKGEGSQDGHVHIFTNDPVYTQVSLPLKVTRRSSDQVQATPQQIRLSKGRKSAMVRLRADGPLKIERVDASGLKCTWADHSSGEVFLKVAHDAAPLMGNSSVRVIFAGRKNALTIPVEWE